MTYTQAVAYRKELEAAESRIRPTTRPNGTPMRREDYDPAYLRINAELAAAIIHEARARR